MTESELCGSSFDWEGGSPSVFFRPMNPALSAQHYFPEDSPVLLDSKENSKRNGLFLTPASPLFGSLSYMSQESSCCSALNNAVIIEDDDNETIPTDERPSLIPLAADDMSPIVESSFNVSDVPPGASFPLIPASEDRSSSSLQELLFNQVAPVDTAFIGNSPGPQWSPGIRSSLKSPTVIRIESTMNYFDGIPSASPKKATGTDSSLSLSAIFPSAQPALPSVTVPKPNFDFSDIAEERAKPVVVDFEPSPVRTLTHQRSIAGSRVSLSSLRLPVREHSFYLETDVSTHRRKIVLSSEERDLKEADEGRRRLAAQIRANRSHVDVSSSGSASARLSARLAENRSRLPRVELSTNSTLYQRASSSFLASSRLPSPRTEYGSSATQRTQSVNSGIQFGRLNVSSGTTPSSSGRFGGTPSARFTNPSIRPADVRVSSGRGASLSGRLNESLSRHHFVTSSGRLNESASRLGGHGPLDVSSVNRRLTPSRALTRSAPTAHSIYTSHRGPTAASLRPAWR